MWMFSKVTNCTTGKEEVVVAGGQGKNWNIEANTEIYNFEDGTWRVGTPLPEANAVMASLPYGDTFIIMGGQADYCSSKIYKVESICQSRCQNRNSIDMSIFQFDPSTRNGSWTELNVGLPRSNRNFLAFYVDSDMFQTCHGRKKRTAEEEQGKGNNPIPMAPQQPTEEPYTAPDHKLDTLLNPDKATQYLSDKERAMEDIRDI